MIEKDVKAFKQYCIGGQQSEAVKAGSGEDDYADKEELTVMEGFKYRVDDGPYPVYRGKQKLEDFPIIPIGMLDVWRSETEGDF